MRTGDLRLHFFMKPLLSLYMPSPFHVLRFCQEPHSRAIQQNFLMNVSIYNIEATPINLGVQGDGL